MDNQTNCKICWIICGVVVVAIGFAVIPRLMRKYSNKLYKKSASKEEIDFDNLGPEIVEKKHQEVEKNEP